jgi:hypothetical protein
MFQNQYYLPKEILLNIISYLDIEEQCKCIYLFNLPKRIPDKLNNDLINNMDNLFIKTRLVLTPLSTFLYKHSIFMCNVQLFLNSCEQIGYNISHILHVIHKSHINARVQNKYKNHT